MSQSCFAAFSGCSCVYKSVFISRSVLGCVTFSMNHQPFSRILQELSSDYHRMWALGASSLFSWVLAACALPRLPPVLPFANNSLLFPPRSSCAISRDCLHPITSASPQPSPPPGTEAMQDCGRVGLPGLEKQDRGWGLSLGLDAAAGTRVWESPESAELDQGRPHRTLPSWMGN